MKLLYLLNSADLAGAEPCLLRLVSEIKVGGIHNVAVLNAEEGILNDKLRKLGITVYVQPSVHVKKIYKLSEIVKLVKNIYAFRRIVNIEEPDVIHAFTLPLARRVILFRIIGISKPVIGTIHDALTVKSFGWRKVKMFTFSINRFYDKLISVSDSTKQIAINSGIHREKIVTIYNGLPILNNRDQNIELLEYTIGYFGRITHGKGQHILLEAVNLLKDIIPNLRCLIVGMAAFGIKGSENYYKSLKEFVLINKISRNVEFIEWTEDINYYYERLNVHVLTSIIPDSFPTVNLEAMMHHKPVIAVNIGGSKEQIIDGVTGFLIEPGSSSILAEKIKFLYDNSLLARKMGEAGYERVITEFSMNKYVTQHLDLYRKCVAYP